MATQIQYRRGTNSQNAAFTGALGEITVDTTNGTLRVHNGITAGGSNIATVAYVAAQISALSSNSITDGTSNVRVFANGNVTTSVGGSANVLNITSTGAIITGDLTVTGNATLSGNILGDRIQNGNTNIDIEVAGGNANISVGGVSNIAVFSTTGMFVTGVASVSGNVTGGNVLTAGIMSSTGNGIHGNVLTSGLISATGAITGAALTGSSLTVTTGNITAGNLLLSGAIIDSAQLDIQTSASNSNIALAPNGTGIVTVSTQVSAVGNVTGGNIRTAGLISATGTVTGSQFNGSGAGLTSIPNGALTNSSITINGTSIALGSSGTVTANASTLTGTTLNSTVVSTSITSTGALNSGSITSGFGAIDIGTDSVTCGSIVNANANGVGNIGSATTYFNTVFAKATSAQYADLAEMYVADAQHAPGTVVVFGGDYEVKASDASHSTNVAGVISTNPSYLMNAAQEGTNVVAVALQGRVPTHVVGVISKGDRLVSSDIPGVATALDRSKYEPGCIIGKALANHQPIFDSNGNEIPGTIEVVVGRV
jgi:hypothetical protein